MFPKPSEDQTVSGQEDDFVRTALIHGLIALQPISQRHFTQAGGQWQQAFIKKAPELPQHHRALLAVVEQRIDPHH